MNDTKRRPPKVRNIFDDIADKIDTNSDFLSEEGRSIIVNLKERAVKAKSQSNEELIEQRRDLKIVEDVVDALPDKREREKLQKHIGVLRDALEENSSYLRKYTKEFHNSIVNKAFGKGDVYSKFQEIMSGARSTFVDELNPLWKGVFTTTTDFFKKRAERKERVQEELRPKGGTSTFEDVSSSTTRSTSGIPSERESFSDVTKEESNSLSHIDETVTELYKLIAETPDGRINIDGLERFLGDMIEAFPEDIDVKEIQDVMRELLVEEFSKMDSKTFDKLGNAINSPKVFELIKEHTVYDDAKHTKDEQRTLTKMIGEIIRDSYSDALRLQAPAEQVKEKREHDPIASFSEKEDEENFRRDTVKAQQRIADSTEGLYKLLSGRDGKTSPFGGGESSGGGGLMETLVGSYFGGKIFSGLKDRFAKTKLGGKLSNTKLGRMIFGDTVYDGVADVAKVGPKKAGGSFPGKVGGFLSRGKDFVSGSKLGKFGALLGLGVGGTALATSSSGGSPSDVVSDLATDAATDRVSDAVTNKPATNAAKKPSLFSKIKNAVNAAKNSKAFNVLKQGGNRLLQFGRQGVQTAGRFVAANPLATATVGAVVAAGLSNKYANDKLGETEHGRQLLGDDGVMDTSDNFDLEDAGFDYINISDSGMDSYGNIVDEGKHFEKLQQKEKEVWNEANASTQGFREMASGYKDQRIAWEVWNREGYERQYELASKSSNPERLESLKKRFAKDYSEAQDANAIGVYFNRDKLAQQVIQSGGKIESHNETNPNLVPVVKNFTDESDNYLGTASNATNKFRHQEIGVHDSKYEKGKKTLTVWHDEGTTYKDSTKYKDGSSYSSESTYSNEDKYFNLGTFSDVSELKDAAPMETKNLVTQESGFHSGVISSFMDDKPYDTYAAWDAYSPYMFQVEEAYLQKDENVRNAVLDKIRGKFLKSYDTEVVKQQEIMNAPKDIIPSSKTSKEREAALTHTPTRGTPPPKETTKASDASQTPTVINNVTNNVTQAPPQQKPQRTPQLLINPVHPNNYQGNGYGGGAR